MTDLELVLTMLSEASTKEISKTVKPEGFDQSIEVAKMGGSVAKTARKEIESKTGKSVISSKLIKQDSKVSSFHILIRIEYNLITNRGQTYGKEEAFY